jgi:hypothetical protein
MRAVVVYESMFGNTRAVAESIGEGLRSRYEVAVLPVGQVDETDLAGVSLLVVGGPTHIWGMSRPSSRRGAVQQSERSNGALVLESGATGPGLREWLAALHQPLPAAVFDTRVDRPRMITGAAAPKITAALRRHGCRIVDKAQSFRVSPRGSVLVPGELERARAWGKQLATRDLSVAGKLTAG